MRFETLEWPLAEIWNRTFDEFKELHGNREKSHALTQCIDEWNRLRDNRPAFATFLDEVAADAEHDDWPHRLRDRLGLGHYSPQPGAEIPVALMRYSLTEVFQSQTRKKLPAACALSSALDGGMHEYFFPVPHRHPYGATLHLAPNQADLLTAEILHCRIDYQPKHLWKLGWISRPHAFANVHDAASEAARDAQLRAARDLHLMQLRIESTREDFGEDMRNRI